MANKEKNITATQLMANVVPQLFCTSHQTLYANENEKDCHFHKHTHLADLNSA